MVAGVLCGVKLLLGPWLKSCYGQIVIAYIFTNLLNNVTLFPL